MCCVQPLHKLVHVYKHMALAPEISARNSRSQHISNLSMYKKRSDMTDFQYSEKTLRQINVLNQERVLLVQLAAWRGRILANVEQ